MSHTETCRKSFDACERERAQWAAKWPKHCRACEGGGVLTYYSHDDGTGASLCQCQDSGQCPRCGAMHTTWDETTDDAITCTACGWDLEHPDTAPGPWECWSPCEDEDERADAQA